MLSSFSCWSQQKGRAGKVKDSTCQRLAMLALHSLASPLWVNQVSFLSLPYLLRCLSSSLPVLFYPLLALLSKLTGTSSEAAAYEFTTLTCIPGNIFYKGTKIQLLDLPGIIEGAAYGKGRGRQVIAVAKSADLVMMVLDAAKEAEKNHRAILERELETVGLRLNKLPPDVNFRKKMTGGVKWTSTVALTHLGEDPDKTINNILHEYRIHNAEITFRQDVTTDEFIDVILGNRKYVRCLYVYNKVSCSQVTLSQASPPTLPTMPWLPDRYPNHRRCRCLGTAA